MAKRRRARPSRFIETEDDRVAIPMQTLSLTRSTDGQPPAEKIKAAVLAALLLNQPVALIASRYNLSYSTVAYWKKSFDLETPDQRVQSLSDNLMVFINQEIQNLIAISIVTSDEDWIKDQTASELSDFLNVKHNTMLKVLEAFGKAQEGVKQNTVKQIQQEIDGMKETGMSEEQILIEIEKQEKEV